MKMQAGQVKAPHEHPELGERADAELADGESHGTEGTDRGQLHDDVDDAEEDVRLDRSVLHALPLFTQGRKGEAEEQRKEEHLEDVTLGKGIDHTCWE